MATKNIKTLNEKLLQKEINRLKRFIKQAEKRGFSFPSNSIPNKPKTVTKKTVARFQKITPEKLYKKATYRDPETGLETTGVKGRQIERKRALEKAQHKRKYISSLKRSFDNLSRPTSKAGRPKGDSSKRENLPKAKDVVLGNIKKELGKYLSTTQEIDKSDGSVENKNILLRMLNGAIRRDGEETVAIRIENYSGNIIELVRNILYYSNRATLQENLISFSSIITGTPLSVEQAKTLSDIQEMQEDNQEPL